MATGTTAEQIIDVVTPAAGESVSEGTILEWNVKVGDFSKFKDTIVEISTDKVDLELPSPGTGTVTEILIDEGETVTVGQVIARIAAADAPGGDGHPGAQTAAAPSAAPPPEETQRAPAPPEETQQPAAAPERPLPAATPVAERAAAVEGVDLAGLSGSGPAGRITKSDVLSAAGNGSALADAGARGGGAAAGGKGAEAGAG